MTDTIVFHCLVFFLMFQPSGCIYAKWANSDRGFISLEIISEWQTSKSVH